MNNNLFSGKASLQMSLEVIQGAPVICGARCRLVKSLGAAEGVVCMRINVETMCKVASDERGDCGRRGGEGFSWVAGVLQESVEQSDGDVDKGESCVAVQMAFLIKRLLQSGVGELLQVRTVPVGRGRLILKGIHEAWKIYLLQLGMAAVATRVNHEHGHRVVVSTFKLEQLRDEDVALSIATVSDEKGCGASGRVRGTTRGIGNKLLRKMSLRGIASHHALRFSTLLAHRRLQA